MSVLLRPARRLLAALVPSREFVTTAGEVIGLGVASFGVGMWSLAAGVVCAGVSLVLMSWLAAGGEA